MLFLSAVCSKTSTKKKCPTEIRVSNVENRLQNGSQKRVRGSFSPCLPPKHNTVMAQTCDKLVARQVVSQICN